MIQLLAYNFLLNQRVAPKDETKYLATLKGRRIDVWENEKAK